jgi:membrane-bound serine protease (ClpP class)
MKKISGYIIIFLLCIINLYCREKVILITIDGAIGPATASYIKSGITEAETKNAQALIIKINTPGGLLESTRDIVQYIFESKVPVIAYVAPPGARAGSAGVFITLSANIAVMAPGTNIGAAHPVGLGGESGDSTSVMYNKVTNDAAAFARTIAQKRNRNQDWAVRAVRESISETENEALEHHAVDFICPTMDSLLKTIDGLNAEVNSNTVILKTAGAEVHYLEKNWREELLTIISDPNIAYILMLIGIYGMFFELYNPGAIFPGVAGGISLILAAYSLQMLPVNYAGIALILLAIILFILEIKVISYGILSIGGVISFVLGSIMLFDSPFELVEVSISLIITAAILTALFFIVIITVGVKAQYRKRSNGLEALIGEKGVAITDISPKENGKIKIHGEIWSAFSDKEIKAGMQVIVESSESMKLIVKSFI